MSSVHEYKKCWYRKKLQHRKVLYWNQAAFWVFIKISHSRNWNFSFSFSACLNPWVEYCAGKRYDMFVSQHNKLDCKYTRYFEESFQVISENVHSQYFSGCESIYMEVIVLEHFNKLKPSTIHMAQFHSRLSSERYQGDSTSTTHLRILLQFLITKKWYLNSWQPCGITQVVAQISIIFHQLFIIYYHVLL